jgi:hypothetical protein
MYMVLNLFPVYGAIGYCQYVTFYRGAGKSLARPTSRCILFDGGNILFDASLVIYTNSTNIPPIMNINRIYETQNHLSL